jgi:hypothetical protein
MGEAAGEAGGHVALWLNEYINYEFCTLVTRGHLHDSCIECKRH